jgi:serine/threonine protein phosphatase PrpC
MNIQESHLSDIGKIRKANEDFVLSTDSSKGLVCVLCDGIGGQAGGAIAAELCATTIVQYLQESTEEHTHIAIENAINKANEVIYTRASTELHLKGMGTTCVVMVTDEQFIYYAHIGDSRLYQYKDHHLIQLTKDHSYVQQLIDEGKIQPSDAETHPHKHQLTAAVGTQITLPMSVQVQKLPLAQNSLFLLCTDGLHGVVSDKIIQSTITENAEKPVSNIVKKLIDLANDFGGVDNITVQIIRVGEIQNIQEKSETHTDLPQNLTESVTKTPLIDPPIETTVSPTTETEQKPKYNIQLSSNQKLGLVAVILVSTIITLFVAFYKNKEKPEEENFLTQLKDTLNTKQDTQTKKTTILKDSANQKITIKQEKEVNQKPTLTDYEYYVQKGDVLSKIASKFNVNIEELKAWNKDAKKKGHPKFPDLNAEAPLIIKVKAKHTVEQGETITSIAEKYYGNVNQKRLIVKANGLKEETTLKKGKTLIIPNE